MLKKIKCCEYGRVFVTVTVSVTIKITVQSAHIVVTVTVTATTLNIMTLSRKTLCIKIPPHYTMRTLSLIIATIVNNTQHNNSQHSAPI